MHYDAADDVASVYQEHGCIFQDKEEVEMCLQISVENEAGFTTL
jgi:hypothetical protein